MLGPAGISPPANLLANARAHPRWVVLAPSQVRDSQTTPDTHNITVRHADLIYHFRIITHMESTDREGGYTFQEHYMVMVSQVMLCVFNIGIVLPGLLAKKKKKKVA